MKGKGLKWLNYIILTSRVDEAKERKKAKGSNECF